MFDPPLRCFTRAREYQIRPVDVKRAPFVCLAAQKISPDQPVRSRAKPSLRRIELMNCIRGR
jgi:hypothetical protein